MHEEDLESAASNGFQRLLVYASSFKVKTCPLMRRANDAHPTKAIAIITVYIPAGNIMDTPIASREGNARMRSAIAMIAVSILPPR